MPELGFFLGQLDGDQRRRESDFDIALSETGNSFLCRLCMNGLEIYGYLAIGDEGNKFVIPTGINYDYSGPWNLASKKEIGEIIMVNHLSNETILDMLKVNEGSGWDEFSVSECPGQKETGIQIIHNKIPDPQILKTPRSRRALGMTIDLEEQTGLILEPMILLELRRLRENLVELVTELPDQRSSPAVMFTEKFKPNTAKYGSGDAFDGYKVGDSFYLETIITKLPDGSVRTCASRNTKNCGVCLASGQTEKTGCEVPIKPQSS